MNKYNAWLSDSDCNPIDGTDRIILAKSRRDVMKYIASEYGIKLSGNKILKLPDGKIWSCMLIENNV